MASAAEPINIEPGVRDGMTLCTDGKSHYVGIAQKMEGSPLFYGDGKQLFHLAEQKGCAVTCGERVTTLKIVPPDEAKALLAKASFFASPIDRVPYALARDSNAVYYYVDHGSTTATEKNFRLFRGRKGALKLQKMTDVASDSEGDIFATKTGSLRLILEKKQSTWIQGKKSTSLTLIPVEQNYQMIYNDLGVYAGIRLGTPCDDL
jgi:hypothetical protein